jgi:hypothetical protein
MVAPRRITAFAGTVPLAAALALLAGCATTPPGGFVVEIPSGITDARSRFSEVYCTVLETHGTSLPDHRSCEEALSHVAGTPPPPRRPVELGMSPRQLVLGVVPGIGYRCVAAWLETTSSARDHLRSQGYDLRVIEVDALSGTTTNARRIRDAILAMPDEPGPARLVLLGYSKGTPDILEAIVTYPEIRARIAGVVSIAGAVGGSPLAEDASEWMADALRYFPGAECGKGDDQSVASLRPEVRRRWLAEHPLPPEVRFYTLVTLPDPDRISWVLKPGYWRLSDYDARNDGQVIYSDQIIPAGSLLGFVNADHWAVVLPIDRAHPVIGTLFVNDNEYPREALLEAVMRFVEDDLGPAR